MDSIDVSKRKPRRTRGTPAYFHRNRFAYITLGIGTALFAAFSLIPFNRAMNREICDKLEKPSVEELERRAMFERPAHSSKYIKETLDERDRLSWER